jgi:hypothetical protein
MNTGTIWNMVRSSVLLCLLALSSNAISQENIAQPEIWLISGSKCNVCEIFDKARENRAYKDSITLQNITFSIKNVNKDNVPKIYKGLVDQIAQDNEYWSVQLNVAVVQGDTILYHGNIAESADWRNGFLEQKYMRPPITATLDELHSFGFNYSDFFESEFNLEHFAKRALDPLERGDFNARLDQWKEIETKDESALLSSQVSILGTAQQPAANGLFISTRIRQLQALFDQENLITTYANGPEKYRDTLVKTGDKYEFVSSGIDAQFSSDLAGMNSWLQKIAESTHDKQLIIQVGHSGPTGAPIWGSALTVTPEALKTGFDKTNKHITLVSGSCHSGLFANVAQCGYYAAHPEAISTGCQTSLEAIESSDDYLKYFFLQNNTNADANEDGQVSFDEAHWYASSKLEKHNISYSDFDATVDEYFSVYPNNVSKAIPLSQLSKLIKGLSAAEQSAYRKMTIGISKDTDINLTNYVSLHKQAIETLREHTESTSTKRNKLSGLEYPLNLVILARRALYAQVQQSKALEYCNTDSVANYL